MRTPLLFLKTFCSLLRLVGYRRYQLYDSVFKNDFTPNSVKVKRFIYKERTINVGDGILSNLPDATGVDTFAGYPLQAFPHLSEAFSQQHRQQLAFLTALLSSSASLLTHHQQHQPELLLFASCNIRRPNGSIIGALLGVALSSSSVSLPKYLEHLLDSNSSSPNRYAISPLTVLTFYFLQQLFSTYLAGWRTSQSTLSEGALLGWDKSRLNLIT